VVGGVLCSFLAIVYCLLSVVYSLPAVNRALKAELLAPAGWRRAGLEPAYELEERILLAQGAPAPNLMHSSVTPHWPWSSIGRDRPFRRAEPTRRCTSLC
jgi:hypothetical protein